MQAGSFFYIVNGNLLERKGRTIGAILVVAFAAAVVTVVAGIGLGFLRGVVKKAEESIPPDMLMVKPKTVNVAMFSLSGAGLTKKTIEKIRAMPGIAYVAPQTGLKVSSRANGTVMGQSAETDAVVIGVGPEVVKDAILPGLKFEDPPDAPPTADGEPDHHTTSPIPAIVPRFLLDMYNLGYAESAGLPKINEQFLHGKEFTLMLGGPTVLMGDLGGQKKTHWLKMKIVGVTSNPALMSGLYIPLSRAQNINKLFLGKELDSFTAAHIKVSDPSRLDAITSDLKAMELMVENQRERLDQIRFLARAANGIIALFAAVVAAISAVSILNTFSMIMAERRGEVGLLRAVGARRSDIVRLYVAEVAIIGLLGGLIGAGVSILLLRFANHAVLTRFKDVTFLPTVLFRADLWVLLSVTAAAVVVCVLAVLPGIRSHSRVSPTDTATAV